MAIARASRSVRDIWPSGASASAFRRPICCFRRPYRCATCSTFSARASPAWSGKSHLAAALCVATVKAGKSVYRATLADLIEALTQAEREGRLTEKIRFYSRASLLIVDEIGHLPISTGGANLLFQLVNARYEKGAMILTSNRGFAEWGKVFGDPLVATALLDRLLLHAVVIQTEGASYRLRGHADLIPGHVRANAPMANSHSADFAAIASSTAKGCLIECCEHSPELHIFWSFFAVAEIRLPRQGSIMFRPDFTLRAALQR